MLSYVSFMLENMDDVAHLAEYVLPDPLRQTGLLQDFVGGVTAFRRRNAKGPVVHRAEPDRVFAVPHQAAPMPLQDFDNLVVKIRSH